MMGEVKQRSEMQAQIALFKREIQKYIQENGTLRQSESTLQLELKSLREKSAVSNTEQGAKDNLLKEAFQEIKDLKLRVKSATSKVSDRDSQIQQMEKYVALGRKLDSGELILTTQKEVDERKNREQQHFTELKSYQEALKKKDQRLVDQSNEVEEQKARISELQSNNDESAKIIAQLKNKLQASETDNKRLNAELKQFKEENNYLQRQLTLAKEEKNKLEGEVKKKAEETLLKEKQSRGLGVEIDDLKQQLFKKIESFNNLNAKKTSLQDIENKYMEEKSRKSELELEVERLKKQISEQNTELSKIKEAYSESAQSLDRQRKEMEAELSLLKSSLSSKDKEISKIRAEKEIVEKELKEKQVLVLEISSKLKGATMRLEEAEKKVKRFEDEEIEKKLAQAKQKADAMKQAAERIQSAMESLKIITICQKCHNMPVEGRTLLPCSHNFCKECDSLESSACQECKKPVAVRSRNPLIDEIKHRYNYMNDAIGFVLNTCSQL